MKDVLNSVKWPGALVVLGMLGLVAFLYSKGATLEALLAVAVALLGWQGQQRAQDSQRLQNVETQTNGVNSGLRAQLDQMSAERAQDLKIMAALASRLPASSSLPPALEQAGMLPVPVSPAAPYYANTTGATAPLQRVDEPPPGTY